MRLTGDKTKRIDIPNDPDFGFINIRALSKEERSSIESKSSETTVGAGGNVVLTINNHNRTNLVAQKCLKGWGNIFDVNGEELKFNMPSLEKVSHMSLVIDGKKVRFLEWVDSVHSDFIAEIEQEEPISEGN